jgi:DASH complex subunit DAD2
MSNYGRPLPSHLRNQSLGGSQQQSPVLLARIAEKKAELANLKDLQALSGGLADQMQMLADKLSTLSDGTEGTPPMVSSCQILGSPMIDANVPVHVTDVSRF